MSSEETKQTSSQKKYTYPSYLDLLNEEQFKALEEGILLAREKKREAAYQYFETLIPQYEHQPYMLTALCVIIADLDHSEEAVKYMEKHFDEHKNSSMFLCGLLRLELVRVNFDRFDELFREVKQRLEKDEREKEKAALSNQQQLENAVVFSEAAYLGVRYCIARNILGQAAHLIQTYEEAMPEHDMHLALKLYLAQALQEVVPNFKLPPQEKGFEPFMDHVIMQIVEQNKEEISSKKS